MKSFAFAFACIVASIALAGDAFAQAAAAKGEAKGSASQHTAQSLAAAVADANVVLPAAATGGAPFVGKLKDAPRNASARVPVVVFLHGSSGLGLKAIGEWQAWLATIGVASVAPDSFTLPDRVTYTSPVGKDFYERIHALRESEIAPAYEALKSASWADTKRVLLAGTSEGAVAVARHRGGEFAGRIVYAWSCEDNYFVARHATAIPADKPVLNVISSADPFFSPTNAWLGNDHAKGHCADALKDHKAATIVLVPGAPHTLINLPMVRAVTAAFVADALKP